MLFPNEIHVLHEYIKGYLKFAKFEDTQECFEAEIKAKIITKRLDDIDLDFTADRSPELFKMMKGVSSLSLQTQKRLRQMEDLNDKYIDLRAGARQIYGLAVRLMAICEDNKAVGRFYTDHER